MEITSLVLCNMIVVSVPSDWCMAAFDFQGSEMRKLASERWWSDSNRRFRCCRVLSQSTTLWDGQYGTSAVHFCRYSVLDGPRGHAAGRIPYSTGTLILLGLWICSLCIDRWLQSQGRYLVYRNHYNRNGNRSGSLCQVHPDEGKFCAAKSMSVYFLCETFCCIVNFFEVWV